jgi:TonB family protein
MIELRTTIKKLLIASIIFYSCISSAEIIETAKIKTKPGLSYPPSALRNDVEGIVKLSVEILANGSVGHVDILQSSGVEQLDKAAIENIEKSTFYPALDRDRVPVTSNITIPVSFSLERNVAPYTSDFDKFAETMGRSIAAIEYYLAIRDKAISECGKIGVNFPESIAINNEINSVSIKKLDDIRSYMKSDIWKKHLDSAREKVIEKAANDWAAVAQPNQLNEFCYGYPINLRNPEFGFEKTNPQEYKFLISDWPNPPESMH